MKKGLTLIELMIVIGIIGILSAVLLKSLGGASDSARAAKCLANLHTLANACQTVAMASGTYPLAGSVEVSKISVNKKKSGLTHEAHGWVSWASNGKYRNHPKGHQASASWFTSTYNKDLTTRVYALTNGAIWQALSGNASVYCCPLHARYAKKKKVDPVWSYVMNSYFGWDTTEGQKSSYDTVPGVWFHSANKLDRRLLFAELAFNTDLSEKAKGYAYKPNIQFGTGSGVQLDPTLQYDKPHYEVIGFNHKNGRKWYAHVCFADGHAEKLELPPSAGAAKIRDLTTWLCEGTEFSLNGSNYEELKK